MADSETVTAAPGNTGTSGGEEQPLLNAGSEAGTAGQAETTEGSPKGEGGGNPENAPLLSPEAEGSAEEAEEAEDGAPESYEPFTLPENFELSGELLERTTSMFKELGLSQKKAQKLVDYYAQRVIDDKAKMLEDLASRRRDWRAEVRSRPNFAAERALAQKGMRAVIKDQDEKELFTDSWLSDHPALWKVFVRIGRLVGEDVPIQGAGRTSAEENINLKRFPNA